MFYWSLLCSVLYGFGVRICLIINEVKDFLHKNNLTIARADKNKAMTIIQTDVLEQEINTFIQQNHITLVKKDPTETFQKLTQQPFKHVTCRSKETG
jgi:hypothetical protein